MVFVNIVSSDVSKKIEEGIDAGTDEDFVAVFQHDLDGRNF